MTEGTAASELRGWTAIAADLELLARLHDREIDAGLVEAMRAMPVADWFALRIPASEFREAAGLIELALARAPSPMTTEALDGIAAEYAAIYLNHTYRISPYESFWVGEDGLERQEPMFAVRKWFARFGFRAPDWRMRGDDHIALELAFLSHVAPDLENPDAAKMIGQFMRQHPLVWIPEFAGRVVRRCQSPLYAGMALLTADYLNALAVLLARVHGLDMTLIRPEKSVQVHPAGPSCADPPPRYAPGTGPGW